MADTVNLYAESGRNIIGDDATPTLTLENTSSGAVLRLQNAGGTGPLLSLLSCPTTSINMTGAGGGLNVYTTGIAGQFGSTAGIALNMVSCPTTSVYAVSRGNTGYLRSTATEGVPMTLDRSICGSASVALLKLSQLSTASAPLFDFGSVSSAVGGVVSTASACATLDYAVRVKVGDAYGWIPVYRAVA